MAAGPFTIGFGFKTDSDSSYHSRLLEPTQNTKPTKELRQTPTSNSICMQQFIYKLFLVRPSIYMLHILQEKF